MSLLTLAQYKSLTGTTATTNDTLISALLPAVQSQLETYCDRKFDRSTYYEWLKYNGEIELDQWPVNNILMIGTVIETGTWTDTSNTLLLNLQRGINSQDGIAGLYVTNQYTLATTFYSFATYTTLATLKTAVEAAHATLTLAYPTAPTYTYASMSTNLLRDCTGNVMYGAYAQPSIQYRIEEGTRRTLIIPANVTTYFQALNYWLEETLFVAYNYGYDNANVPSGLQLTLSNIIKDMVNITTSSGGGLYKSQTITNYSETTWDTAQINKLITERYTADLEPFRRKSIMSVG